MVEVRKMSEGLGAEVIGVDVTNLKDGDFDTIYRAFLDHCVVVIKGQKMDIPQYLQYSNRIGKVVPHITVRSRHPDYPEIMVLGGQRKKSDGSIDEVVVARGEGWHTDTPYLAVPAKATQLYAIEIPSYGGDTLFANMYAAYEALPQRLKQRIEGRKAVFKYSGKSGMSVALLDGPPPAPVTHDIVQVHPETGRTSLYVNPIHTIGIAGMEEKESDALLEELYTYIVQPGCEYRHKWTVGDIVVWDNRCTIHSAAGGYPLNESRIHWRVTIMSNAETEARAARRIAS